MELFSVDDMKYIKEREPRVLQSIFKLSQFKAHESSWFGRLKSTIYTENHQNSSNVVWVHDSLEQ